MLTVPPQPENTSWRLLSSHWSCFSLCKILIDKCVTLVSSALNTWRLWNNLGTRLEYFHTLRQFPLHFSNIGLLCWLWLWPVFSQSQGIPPHWPGSWGCVGGWEETQPAQVTQTDHGIMLNVWQSGEREEEGMNVWSDDVCIPKSLLWVMGPWSPRHGQALACPWQVLNSFLVFLLVCSAFAFSLKLSVSHPQFSGFWSPDSLPDPAGREVSKCLCGAWLLA